MIKVTKNFRKLEIEVPKDPRFWQSVGIETVSTIREDTEKGIDADGSRFKQYSAAYKKYRAQSGRSTTVNLTWRGQMLSAMGRGIRATRSGVKVIVSGEQGYKIWVNEQRGREFFAISKKTAQKTLRKITRWIDRHN